MGLALGMRGTAVPSLRVALKGDGELLLEGDAFELLQTELRLPEIQTIVTSPTYWGKRQFTEDPREFGKEPLETYVERCTRLFSGLMDLLREDGSLFFVMQDSRMGSGISRTQHFSDEFFRKNPGWMRNGNSQHAQGNTSKVTASHPEISNASWCGIPFRIAAGLTDKGWVWRDLIIWDKPNPMPDKHRNRMRQSSEFIFHFTKGTAYKYHPEAVSIPGGSGRPRLMNQVWNDPVRPTPGHSATFPSSIVRRLVLATTDPEDWVLDPMMGSGTVFRVCRETNRKFVGCDLNSEFVESVAGLSAQRVLASGSPPPVN